MITRKHVWAYQKLGWTDLSRDEQAIFESIELDLLPYARQLRTLLEAEMSNDEINDLFKAAEDISRENNLRTGFGQATQKTGDFTKATAQKVNQIINTWGEKLKNSKEVQGADEKFRELKTKIRDKMEKDPRSKRALAALDALGGMMNSRPWTQAAILGLLSFLTVSTLGLGTAGIGITAGVLMAATEMVKGSDLSTAVGKGIKAGVLGFIGSALAHAVAGWFADLRISQITPVGPAELGIDKMSFSGRSVTHTSGMEWTRWFKINNVTLDTAMRGQVNDTILRMASGDLGAYDQLLALARKAASPAYQSELTQRLASATAAKIANDGFLNSIITLGKYITAAAGSAAGASVAAPNRQSAAESHPIALPVMEGLWADLTLKFGAGKLRKAWQQMGRPTDSVDIARMLASMGMDDDNIRAAFAKAGVGDDVINATMQGLANTDDETDLDIPFLSGDDALDKDAKQILKSKGKDAFIKYWQDKLAELEHQMQTQTQSAATGTQDDGKADADIVKDVATLIKYKKWKAAQDLIAANKFTGPDISRIEKLLDTAPGQRKSEIKQALKKAAYLPLNEFWEISSMLKNAGSNWKALGYNMVIHEQRTQTVILL